MDTSTLNERLRLLGERYYLVVGPLLLVFGVSKDSSQLLAWTAFSLLALLMINKAILLLRY